MEQKAWLHYAAKQEQNSLFLAILSRLDDDKKKEFSIGEKLKCPVTTAYAKRKS